MNGLLLVGDGDRPKGLLRFDDVGLVGDGERPKGLLRFEDEPVGDRGF